MPQRYVCSRCGKPVSPAQERCPHCGAEIDWQKAVGRVVRLQYTPVAQRRRRRRRQVMWGLVMLVGLVVILAGVWNLPWSQKRWALYLGPEAYEDYQQGVASLKAGELAQARTHFDAMLQAKEHSLKPTPIAPGFGAIHVQTMAALSTLSALSTLTPHPTSQPTSSAPSTEIPTVAPTPIPIPTPMPSPTPDVWPTVESLVQQAEARAAQDPCAAAEMMAQALSLADTPELDVRHRELEMQCRGVVGVSPLPTPAIQQLVYTAYDAAGEMYVVRLWDVEREEAGAWEIRQAMEPAWGPDGMVVFRGLDPRAPGIYLRRADGTFRRLTKGPDDRRPRWGPWGQQVLFTSSQRSPDQSPHLYLVDIESRGVEDLGPGEHGDWSADGRIVLHGCEVGGVRCGLWLMDATTLQQTPLTQVPDDQFPTWSPDGRWVAFMSSGRGESWDVFVLEVETGQVLAVGSHPGEDGLPAWSPDGRGLAFLSNRAGDWGIYGWRWGADAVSRLLTVGASLPNWQQAGLDWVR